MSDESGFLAYLAMDRGQLLRELAGVTEELAATHRELAAVRTDERRTKALTWKRTEADSVTARIRDTDYAAAEATCEVHRLEGDVAALVCEQELLAILLAEGGRG
jgi:hypothetical protein